jgi:rhodanese-related sulfurtransferase
MRKKEEGNMKKVAAVVVTTLFLVTLLNVTNSIGAEEYPLRAKYPTVKPIETNELTAAYGKAIIVDSRNAAEYDVIQIANAKNILVGKMTEQDLLKLRPKNDSTPLVFYCNGITCAKSYKAAEDAGKWGFQSVRCYDAGIFAWAKANPDKTKFFDKVLAAAELHAALISDSQFKSVLLPPKEFISRSKSGEYTVIDIRDPNERSETQFSLPNMKVMSFDTIVDLVKKRSKAIPTSNLLFVDNVGKQVQWLQYYLKKAGFTNYFFAEGGVLKIKKEGF